MSRIAVTGSIATDYLMSFPARFTDQLVASELSVLSLSFLADELDIRQGGAGANIAYGLGRLGADPILIGAIGKDFDDSWLRNAGVNTEYLLTSSTSYTARFMCTTDVTQNQIATFYAGAMRDARLLDIAQIAKNSEPFDLVVISPNDPSAMLKYTDECRAEGLRFASDPSQQIARLDRKEVRSLIVGAVYLFTNEYENALLRERSGWTVAEILDRVGMWVTTRGDRGVRIERRGQEPLNIAATSTTQILDPTGAGDGFRAGFLFGIDRRLSIEESAQLGCVIATTVLEFTGAQDYHLSSTAITERLQSTYGRESADAVRASLLSATV